MANLRKKVSLDMIKATLYAISKKVGLRFMKAKPFRNNFMNNQKSFSDFSEHIPFAIRCFLFDL